jgi:hypothetical protein
MLNKFNNLKARLYKAMSSRSDWRIFNILFESANQMDAFPT